MKNSGVKGPNKGKTLPGGGDLRVSPGDTLPCGVTISPERRAKILTCGGDRGVAGSSRVTKARHEAYLGVRYMAVRVVAREVEPTQPEHRANIDTNTAPLPPPEQ
jgi:hypothetical protein